MFKTNRLVLSRHCHVKCLSLEGKKKLLKVTLMNYIYHIKYSMCEQAHLFVILYLLNYFKLEADVLELNVSIKV